MSATLFYDGRCALCSKEMRLLTRLKRPDLHLLDIHTSDLSQWQLPPIETPGLTATTQLLSVLHLRTAEGRWLLGLDATVAAWSYTPLGWLFKPLRWPLIRPIADTFYTRWAQARACRLGYV